MTITPTNHTYPSNGLNLHYVAWGKPNNPTIIIHHGFLDQCRAWDPVAQQLAHDWYVVIPDARGHGDSDWIGPGGSYYFPDYIYDLKALFQHLGDRPAFLVGHSMGGAAVSYFAGAYPELTRGLVIIEGLGPPNDDQNDSPKRLKRFVHSLQMQVNKRVPKSIANIEEAAARIRRSDPLISEPISMRLAQHATRPHPDGGLAWKYDPLHRALMGIGFNVDVAIAIWRKIEAPVMLVEGGKSRFIIPDHAVRKKIFPNAKQAVVSNGGHNLHAHEPDALYQVLNPFFSALL